MPKASQSVLFRKSGTPPRNPAKGHVSLWFNRKGNPVFEDDDGHTRQLDTAAFEFDKAAPTPTSSGKQGDVRVVGGYMYICYEQNKWGRTALATSW